MQVYLLWNKTKTNVKLTLTLTLTGLGFLGGNCRDTISKKLNNFRGNFIDVIEAASEVV